MPIPNPVPRADELTPRDWWALLVRQRVTAAAAALLVGIGGLVVSATARPLYRAQCRVVVAEPTPQAAVSGELPPLPAGENTATQVELLLSEALLRQAREAADLEQPDASRFHVRIENTPGSEVIDVVAEGPRADGVAALANALVEQHVAGADQSRSQALRNITAFLVQEQAAAKGELERIDRRIGVLRDREKKPAVVLKPGSNGEFVIPAAADTPQLKALRTQLHGTSTKIVQLRRELELGGEPTNTVGRRSPSESVLPDVWSRLTVLQDRLRQQKMEYLRQAQASVERTATLQVDTELRALRHRREAAHTAFKSATERLVEVRARSVGAGKPFRSVEPATVPERPFWPEPRVQFGVTLLGAVGAGLLAAVVRERRVARVETAEQVERLGLSLLGTVPSPVAGMGPDGDGSWGALLDGLEYAGIGRSTRVLLILPVSAASGGIGLSAAVARLLAEAGRTVGWVDGDLRPRSLDGVHPVRRGLGLSQVLAGMRNEDQVLEAGEVPNLWRLAAGPPPPNPLDLLGSQAASMLLTRLRERFEMVVMEAHPCLDRPDAQRLAGKVDGIVIAADWGRLRPDELMRAAETTREAGGTVVGVVLVGTPPRGGKPVRCGEGHSTGSPSIYRRGGQRDETV